MRCLLTIVALAGCSLVACNYPNVGEAPVPKHFGDDDDDSTGDDDSADSADTSQAQTQSTKVDATNPFSNADDYQAALPQLRASTAHTSGGAGVVPNYKQQCLSCHTGSPGPKFSFGGSIYLDSALSQPGKSLQLGIVDASGAAVITTADADGNFWMEAASTLKFPVYAAARSASGTKQMTTKITSAEQLDCNSCHGTSNPLTK